MVRSAAVSPRHPPLPIARACLWLLAALLVVLQPVLAPSASAQLKIEITGAGASQSPIAIVPFAGEDRLAQALTPVIIANLQRSGLFRIIDVQDVRPLPVQRPSFGIPISVRGAPMRW